MPEKALKCPFSKKLRQKSSFWNISQNEFHTSFLPYFDTQHLICKNFHFVRRRVPGGPRTLKKINDVSKLFLLGVVKRFF